jgi:hypothetical protein
MKKLFSTLFILVFISSYAQESAPSETNQNSTSIRHYVGFNSGYVSGVGPTYRLDANHFRFQATLLPIISEEVTWFSSGMTFGYSKMNWKNDIDIYPYLGVAFYYDEQTNYYYDYVVGEFEVVEQNERLNIGIGFSFDKNFGNYFTASVRGGYATYLGTGKTPSYTLTGEVALFYRFGLI